MRKSECPTSSLSKEVREDILPLEGDYLSDEDYEHISRCRQSIDKVFETDASEEIKYKVARYNCVQILQLLPNNVDELRFDGNILATRITSRDKDEKNIWDKTTLDEYLQIQRDEVK